MIFTEEQREIQALVHAFAEKEIRPLSRKYDELGEFPMELYKKACRMQLNCLDLPEKYGGTGVSKVTSCLIREGARLQAAAHCRKRGAAQALCRCVAQ